MGTTGNEQSPSDILTTQPDKLEVEGSSPGTMCLQLSYTGIERTRLHGEHFTPQLNIRFHSSCWESTAWGLICSRLLTAAEDPQKTISFMCFHNSQLQGSRKVELIWAFMFPGNREDHKSQAGTISAIVPPTELQKLSTRGQRRMTWSVDLFSPWQSILQNMFSLQVIPCLNSVLH